MILKIKPLSWLVTLVLISAFVSCRKLQIKPKWEVEAYIPIAKSSLSISKLVGDSLIHVNDDNSLQFVYEREIYKLKLDSLIALPDTTVSYVFQPVISGLPFAPGQSLIDDTSQTRYNLSGAQLKDAKFRTGLLEINVINTFPEAIYFEYELLLSSDTAGNPFVINDFVAGGSFASPTIKNITADLSGFFVKLNGLNANKYNTVTVRVKAYVDPNGAVMNPTSAQYITLNNKFVGIVPEYAHGYFGQQTYTQALTQEPLDLFKNIVDGSFNLSDLSMEVSLVNEVGADVQGKIQVLSAYNSKTNVGVTLNHPIINSSINITRASERGTGYPPVIPTKTSVNFNQDNSNIVAFVENQPDFLNYALNLTFNPLGNVSNDNDFIYYNTGIALKLKTTLDLHLSAQNLTLLDTIKLNGASLDSINWGNVQGGEIIINSKNAMPLGCVGYLHLMDSLGNKLGDQLEIGTINAAQVDANQVVVAKTSTSSSVAFDTTVLENLKKARKAEIKLVFDTPNSPDKIKIYAADAVDVAINLVLDYLINGEDE